MCSAPPFRTTYLTEFHGDAEIVRYTTSDDILVDLEGGRLDAMFIDYSAGEGLLEGSARASAR